MATKRETDEGPEAPSGPRRPRPPAIQLEQKKGRKTGHLRKRRVVIPLRALVEASKSIAKSMRRAPTMREVLAEMAAIPDDPPGSDEEFMRIVDAERPHRPLFEGYY